MSSISICNMERNLNALLVLIISSILLGACAIQVFEDETPCPLCFLQRLGMFGVATGALMNCRFGRRALHYGLSLISALFGGAVALRQIALHICPGSPKFGLPFWGLNLYTWSFLVFACSVAYIALLLIFFDRSKKSEGSMNAFGHLAFIAAFGLEIANIVTSLVICGWGTCG